MSSLTFYLKHAIRSLVKSPGLFVTTALLLALGIGATAAIYSVVSRVLLDPLPYREPDRLVMIRGELAARDVMYFPEAPTNLHDYQKQSQLLEAIGGVTTVTQPFVREGVEPRQLTTGVVSWNFLSILGVEPILRRGFTAEDGAFNASEVPPGTQFPATAFLPPRTALISYHLWQQAFGGDPAAIAAIGLYAVIHYAVRQRRAEIGVRISFGAEQKNILALFVRYGMIMAAAGFGAGTLAALGLSRGISGLLVGVTANDPLTYGTTALFFALIALVATLVPAWRASRVDPMRVLREE